MGRSGGRVKAYARDWSEEDIVSASPRSGILTGLVSWYDNAKGFGFISLSPNDQSPDVFVHYSDIRIDDHHYGTLTKGQAVEFELEPTPKGPKAIRVRPRSR